MQNVSILKIFTTIWLAALVVIAVWIGVAVPQLRAVREPSSDDTTSLVEELAPRSAPRVTELVAVSDLRSDIVPKGLDKSLPDFTTITNVRMRKLEFFSYLLPMVEAQNRRLNLMRHRLEYIHDHVRFDRPIDDEDRRWLTDIVAEFKIPYSDLRSDGFWHHVLLRVDIVPEHLVLVQAANESAWGTSRFAREGNNLFGQWCFRPGCGIVPENRPEGQTYEVAQFSSVYKAVGSYIRNLNVGHSYTELRQTRANLRRDGKQPDATAMASGLIGYSQRREAYVAEIQAMIRQNAAVIDEARRHLAAGGPS